MALYAAALEESQALFAGHLTAINRFNKHLVTALRFENPAFLPLVQGLDEA